MPHHFVKNQKLKNEGTNGRTVEQKAPRRKSTKGKGMQKRIKGGLGTIGKKEQKMEVFTSIWRVETNEGQSVNKEKERIPTGRRKIYAGTEQKGETEKEINLLT